MSILHYTSICQWGGKYHTPPYLRKVTASKPSTHRSPPLCSTEIRSCVNDKEETRWKNNCQLQKVNNCQFQLISAQFPGISVNWIFALMLKRHLGRWIEYLRERFGRFPRLAELSGLSNCCLFKLTISSAVMSSMSHIIVIPRTAVCE